MSYPIVWMPSPKHTNGHPAPLLAIVHHRMVGTLAGTDTTFTTGTRVASTNFGIGYCVKHGPKRICIHQYVRLGDQAWGNGNWDASGQWDDRYPTTFVNSRTVSIEHEDGGGKPRGSGKGVVTEPVLEASLWLDRLLLGGNQTELAAAGVRLNGNVADAFCRELRAIPVDAHHIIDHHYIAGRLKPSCWRPWADDPTGFPQARYLATLGAPPEEPMKSFVVPELRTLALVKDGSWLYQDSSLAADPQNVNLSPARELVLVGTFSASVSIVAYEPRAGDVDDTSKALFVRTADIASTSVEVPCDQADLDAANAAGYAAAKAAATAAVGGI